MKVGELKIVNRELGEMIDERINTNNGVENEEQEINLRSIFTPCFSSIWFIGLGLLRVYWFAVLGCMFSCAIKHLFTISLLLS